MEYTSSGFALCVLPRLALAGLVYEKDFCAFVALVVFLDYLFAEFAGADRRMRAALAAQGQNQR
jgi:hypothetical protein